MTGAVVRRPRTGEATIVMAWPIRIELWKCVSGVGLFVERGAALARGRQIWIGRPPRPAS